MVPAGQRMEEACREYQSSLEDLTFNSKPHINMLTILAEENVGFAKDIVAIIEAQISKAPAAEKLPVLYLVDSIVKNVGGEFIAVFAKNIITSFICVFEKVDENTRKSLFKLRSTWDEVFPLKKLYLLDVRINALDPAWPIKPLPPTVNASIHVNPRFLKQSEEISSPAAAAAAAAPAPPPAALPPPPPPSTVSQSSVTQEQLIRQQLLAKQKQLLELQQKKIELELEQTKAQLAGGFAVPNTVSTPTPLFSTNPKSANQPTFMVRPWIPSPAPTDTKPSTRDPRLNRPWPPVATAHKELPAGKKDGFTTTSHTTPEKKQVDKPSRPDRTKTPRKDGSEDKSRKKDGLEDKIRNAMKEGLEDKPKASTAKGVQIKNKPAEPEPHKAADGSKKDPRLKKRPRDKTVDAKDEEKKRFSDRKEREETPRAICKAKLVNGSVAKQDDTTNDKTTSKTGGNARLHPRKRTHSRSRSRSPAASPKRKDRRSPKSRTRSSSLSPSPSRKMGKPRRGRADEPLHVKPGREDRLGPKKNQSEARRSKRPAEDRRSESRDSHSPRGHDGGGKDSKEAQHRWKSGWEENKHQKMGGVGVIKGGAQRHKPYSTLNRPSTPHTPKHRLSVDSNLQIPDVLNSASKKDLLRRASKRLESGEITKEEFLNMAHQLRHFFQYQEEKQQRSDSWDETLPFGKQPLLSSPTAPNQGMDQAELSYYEHKSKLRKTQVNHHPNTEEWEGDGEGAEAGKGEKISGGRSIGVPPIQQYGRTPRDRAGEQRSKEREEARPSHAMIDDYNHGKEFPPLKSLPGLRFRRRADPQDTSEREWTSPLTERQHLTMRDEHKSSYDAPRRGPPVDPRRPEGQRNCPSPAGREAGGPRYERLSPLKDVGDLSPRFESPNSEHSDDATPPNLEGPPPPHIMKGPPRVAQLSLVRQHGSSPTRTPPHDGGTGPSHYNGPAHMAQSRPLPWYEGGGPQVYKDSTFEGPQPPGPGRFEGRLHHERTDQGPIRAGDGMVRFEGPPQGPGVFMGQQPPLRFEAPGPGLQHLEAQIPRFEVPPHFNNMAPPTTCGPLGPAPSSGPPQGFQHHPMHFEGPSRFENPVRFEGPGQGGPRFDMPHQPGAPRFEYTPGQPQGPRFAPQHSLHPPVRPMVQPMFEGPMAPQQNFPLVPQRFPEPINPQLPTGGPMVFHQPNLQPGGGYNLQPAFNQPGTFYQHTQPTEVNLLPNTFQSFLNPGPFSQQAPPVAVENHLSQVDVNDLLSKLISTGIIKASQPDAAAPPSGDSASEVPAAPLMEEEEEEEQEEEEDDIPDLTAFNVEDMKQRLDSVVVRLYSGNQCCLCSMRFTAAQTDLYADHLDWHFRQNHAGKVPSKKVTHRRWYYSLTDWIEFEEIADLEERAKSHFFEKENEEEVQKNQAAAKEKEFQSVKATKDQVGECCEICQEPFETYWVEEEEDWFLKNAVRVDDKNFHPSCFEDYSKTSSYLDTPPSPTTPQSEHNQPPEHIEHSLETQEADEATSCVVKQEVKSECEQAS